MYLRVRTSVRAGTSLVLSLLEPALKPSSLESALVKAPKGGLTGLNKNAASNATSRPTVEGVPLAAETSGANAREVVRRPRAAQLRADSAHPEIGATGAVYLTVQVYEAVHLVSSFASGDCSETVAIFGRCAGGWTARGTGSRAVRCVQ